MVIRLDETMVVNGRMSQVGVSFREISRGYKRRVAVFECMCGSRSVKEIDSVRRGLTRSCGCLDAERKRLRGTAAGRRSKTHGMSTTRAFKTHSQMLQRCLNQKHRAYPRYGGRGIDVCERWRSFENFIEDMGHPQLSESLDRIDNNNGYSPENCRWATRLDQANNKRNNVKLTIDSETKSVSEWCRKASIATSTVYNRLKRGWPAKEAVFGQNK